MADAAVRPALPSPADDERTILPRLVPGHLRAAFLPRVFGPAHFSRGEAAVFDWMARLCPTYCGGYWQFYDLTNGGFFLALDPQSLRAGSEPSMGLLIRAPGNGFEGVMSCEAAGIVATMYAINQLLWQGADQLDGAFYKLRDFAAEHAERRLILAAVD